MYSYAEVQKDNKFSGYGLVAARLGKVGAGSFNRGWSLDLLFDWLIDVVFLIGWLFIFDISVQDSIKDFDCCSITLQPCRNPVVTADGYLFDKEAILEYIVSKKVEIAKQQKAYDKWQAKQAAEQKELADAQRQTQVDKFQKSSSTVVTAGNTLQFKLLSWSTRNTNLLRLIKQSIKDPHDILCLTTNQSINQSYTCAV